MSRFSAPSLIVIDASAIIEMLLRTPTAERIERAVGDAELIAPDVLNAEVANGLRGHERGGKLSGTRAATAIARLAESNIGRVPTRLLLSDVWSLRENLSAYDACYVALASSLGCSLLTADRRLARAPRLAVTVISV